MQNAHRNALLAGGGVALAVAAFGIVGLVLSWIQSFGYGARVADVVSSTPAALGSILLHAIVLGAAVAVVAWWLVPVPDGTTLLRLLVGAAVATAAASIVLAVLGLLGRVIGSIGLAGPLFGNSFPGLSIDYGPLGGLLGAIVAIPLAFLADLPLVALVTIVVVRMRGELRRAA